MSRQSQAGLVAVLVLAIGLPAIAVMFKPASHAEPAATTVPLPTEVAAAPTPTAPLRTPFPTSTASLPTPTPTPASLAECALGSTLPAAPATPTAPSVGRRSMAMVFSSSLYGRSTDGQLYARDQGRSVDPWAVGVWFAAPGSGAPRLITASVPGVVLPLALSPSGDRVIVWWLPVRRGADEPACQSAIYEAATDGSESHILQVGDWSVDRGAPGVTPTWVDPDEGQAGGSRAYDLPRASFSADGTAVALVTDHDIRLFAVDEPGQGAEQIGACPQTAWAPKGATFVAGCEQLTSAWIVSEWRDSGSSGFSESHVALPQPDLAVAEPGWEVPSAGAMGFDSDGRVLVVRFYGFATGCEEAGCTIPAPAYTVSTVDQPTGQLSSRGAEVRFLVGIDGDPSATLAPGGSWIYAPIDAGTVGDKPASRLIDLASGAVVSAPYLGRIVGASPDGRLLYGTHQDTKAARVVVTSLDASGTTHGVVAIAWPEAEVSQPIIAVWGLTIAVP